MTQKDFGTINPATKSGTALATDLNEFRDAQNTNHSGLSRPSYVQAGMVWIDTSAAPIWIVKLHDGSDDIVLYRIDTTNNIASPQQTRQETVKTADYTLVAEDAYFAIVMNKASAGVVTLPALSGTGNEIYFVKNIAANPVTIDANASETIDGALNIKLAQYETAWIWPAADKGSWRVSKFFSDLNPWVDVASATTTDIGAAASQNVRVTGTTTITGLGTVAAGTFRRVRFAAALTLTHNATSLILPGAANVTTAAGDVAEFVSEGSGNWRCVNYLAISYPPGGAVLQAAQATTSGTQKDFTIPAGANKVTVNLVDVSTTGTGSVRVQLGTGTTPETTGYIGTVDFNGTKSELALGSGFFDGTASANARRHGSYVLTRADAVTNTWTINGGVSLSNVLQSGYVFGSKAVSGPLNIIRVVTGDAFDAGFVSVLVE
jgi:hypothetical protein